jgi:hypothetical protein
MGGLDSIETEIWAALQPIPVMAKAEGWLSDAQWTAAVKKALVCVGRKFGHGTAASGCESDEGAEWLYDVVWWKSDSEGDMTDVPLVAESEWGGEKAIQDDFQKLLVARSKYRVMVFQGKSEIVVKDRFEKMRRWVEKFKGILPTDRFLLVGWAQDHWVFDHIP